MSPFCSSIYSFVVSFFSSCFLVSIHMCFPFLSFVFSLLKQVFGTSALFVCLLFCLALLQLYLFLHVCPFSLSGFFHQKKFPFFVFIPMCFWPFSFFALILYFLFFLCFSFLPLLNVCLFWWFSLIWFSFFVFSQKKQTPFTYSLLKIKKIGVSRLFLLFFFKGRNFPLCFLFLPVFLFFRERFSFWLFVLTSFWSFLFYLFTFPIQKTFS